VAVPEYELVIAGGGPAGLTAGLYAARGKLRTLLIEKMVPGGQAASTFLIENYPGFSEGISGSDLAQAMETQAKRFGLEMMNGEVNRLTTRGQSYKIRSPRGR
jgi:thioredoxin reductase (NADPH)